MKIRALSLIAVLTLTTGGKLSAEYASPHIYSENNCQPSPSAWMPKGSQSSELMWSNAITIDVDKLMWNGNHVSNREFKRLLAGAASNPFGGIVLIVGPSVPCNQVDEFRRTITEDMKCGPDRICVEYSAQAWQETLPPPLPSKRR